MARQKHMAALAAAMFGAVVVAGTVRAQTQPQSLTPPYQSYAAKFSCGPLKADSDVVEGTYATSINIHNPQAKVSVTFFKKVVIALPEDVTPRGQIYVLNPQEVLQPDFAERVDCPVIYAATKISAKSHIEGFVVIQIPADSSCNALALDVVGKYSARSPAAGFSVRRLTPECITN
jgi:hypothetical protein